MNVASCTSSRARDVLTRRSIHCVRKVLLREVNYRGEWWPPLQLYEDAGIKLAVSLTTSLDCLPSRSGLSGLASLVQTLAEHQHQREIQLSEEMGSSK